MLAFVLAESKTPYIGPRDFLYGFARISGMTKFASKKPESLKNRKESHPCSSIEVSVVTIFSCG